MISREELAVEIKLREQISKAIKIVKKRKTDVFLGSLQEEISFRALLKNIILEAATEDPEKDPHPSTGINVLEDLLKKIVKILEDDFKYLTTDETQRTSFRAHIIHAVKNTLAPVRSNEKAGIETEEPPSEDPLSEAVEVDIIDADDEEKFIDIEGDPEPEEPSDPRDDFGIEGEDETGRNAAYETFKKVENQIVDAYGRLGNPDDQEVFYDYLVTNLKLYFDKFETELQTSLDEPSTPEYEAEKDALEEPAAEEGLPPEEELDL